MGIITKAMTVYELFGRLEHNNDVIITLIRDASWWKKIVYCARRIPLRITFVR